MGLGVGLGISGVAVSRLSLSPRLSVGIVSDHGRMEVRMLSLLTVGPSL
jgi:hypothetical protein